MELLHSQPNLYLAHDYMLGNKREALVNATLSTGALGKNAELHEYFESIWIDVETSQAQNKQLLKTLNRELELLASVKIEFEDESEYHEIFEKENYIRVDLFSSLAPGASIPIGDDVVDNFIDFFVSI